jgi:hypothetical protein
VALREINHLELDLLELIQFELYVDTKVYLRFYEELRNPVLHPSCTCMYQQSQCAHTSLQSRARCNVVSQSFSRVVFCVHSDGSLNTEYRL